MTQEIQEKESTAQFEGMQLTVLEIGKGREGFSQLDELMGMKLPIVEVEGRTELVIAIDQDPGVGRSCVTLERNGPLIIFRRYSFQPDINYWQEAEHSTYHKNNRGFNYPADEMKFEVYDKQLREREL